MRIILILAVLFCASCAARRPVAANWRLAKQGAGDVLIPPGVATPDLTMRTFNTELDPGSGTCPPSVRIKRKRVFAKVTREMLLQQPQGGLATWAAAIESQGCIAPGEGGLLAARIAESLPLDPAFAFHLLYPNDRQTGQVDIAPPVRLQIVSPILRDGAPPDAPIVDTSGNGNSITVTLKSSDNLIGYETAWYAAQPRTGGPGFTIVPLYADRHLKDDTQRASRPATNYLQFASDAAFYRLFYKSGQTDFTALVVSAPTRAELDRRTAMLDADAASRDKLDPSQCVAIPWRVAINPMIPVTVNGAEVMVPWGANVAEAIRDAGERQPETVLPRLAVSRLYKGHPANVDFDRSNPAVLRLILTGSEVILWKPL